MKYRRLYNSGMLLLDIMIALALAMIFFAIISDSSFGLRSAFDRAREKNSFLSDFLSSSTLSMTDRLYGNDRTQGDIGPLSLMKVRASADINISTSLCAVDFGYHDSVNITPILLPIDPTLPLTDLIVRNGIAYISIDSNIASDPDVLIIDFKDRSRAVLLSSINTGPGISDITLAKDYLYAAAASTASQLHVIHLDSLRTMSLTKKFQLPLPFATATPARGSSIFFDEDHVYLGSDKNDSDEISIIDVSQPSSPLKLGGFETGSKVNDLYVVGNMLFVADSDQSQFRIIDVHDSSHPTLFTDFGPSGWTRQEGKTVSYFESALGLGRTSGGFDITSDHELFHFSSTSISTLPATHMLGDFNSNNIPGGVYGLIEDRSHIYLVTRELNKEFQIFNLVSSSTASTSIQTLSIADSYSLPIAPQRLVCDGEYMYVLAGTAPVIYEISFK